MNDMQKNMIKSGLKDRRVCRIVTSFVLHSFQVVSFELSLYTLGNGYLVLFIAKF